MIAQHDTPERILAHPANKFVAEFLGSGATLKGLNLMRAHEIELDDITTVREPLSRHDVSAALDRAEGPWILYLDEAGVPRRWLDRSALDEAGAVEDSGKAVQVTVEPEDTLSDALEKMLQSAVGTACVVNPDGSYRGVVRLETLMQIIDQMQTAERERQAAVAAGGASS